jgi:recombination protein RecR
VDPIRRCVAQLSRLPGIGEKTAQRLTWWLLQAPDDLVGDLAMAIGELKGGVVECSTCQTFASTNPCKTCSDVNRTRETICVVERPQDMAAIERSGEYRGLYHVLHGAISPLDGVGPDQLRIRQLLARMEGVEEVILATDPDVEGDATALYVARLIKPLGVGVSRLAHGIAVGTEIEYADRVSLLRALENRRPL